MRKDLNKRLVGRHDQTVHLTKARPVRTDLSQLEAEMKTCAENGRAFFESISTGHDDSYRPGIALCERWHSLIGSKPALTQLLELHLAFNRFWCEEHPGTHGVFVHLSQFAGWVLSEIDRRYRGEMIADDWRAIGQTFIDQFVIFDSQSAAADIARAWLEIIDADEPATRQSFHLRVERDLPPTVGVGFLHGFIKVWAWDRLR